jgi:hypothetical protein
MKEDVEKSPKNRAPEEWEKGNVFQNRLSEYSHIILQTDKLKIKKKTQAHVCH